MSQLSPTSSSCSSPLPSLWPHQQSALDASVLNKFESGVHAHATGAGKSRLGHALLRAFAKNNPGTLMFWLCEQTSVIRDIFDRAGSRNGFIVCDLVSRKPKEWWWTVQSSLHWNKPVLVIVNRAFLVSQKRYTKLTKSTIGLIVHDECHSGTGNTTKEFYTWLKKHHPNTSIIGLSATPPSKATAPTPVLTNVISRFSIYDATLAKIIVPLRIYWSPKRTALSTTESGNLINTLATKEGVKKIVVWCGTIEHCYETANVWRKLVGKNGNGGFGDGSWLIAVDTSRPGGAGGFATYKTFTSHPGRGLLFCAAKHREGSDIEGLGMAVFMDGVEKRGPAVFVQCAGRAVRQGKDINGNAKKIGIIVDIQAKDGLELCDRVGQFLQLPPGSAPWKRGTDGQLNHLTLTPLAKGSIDAENTPPKSGGIGNLPEGSIADLKARFVREIPIERPEYSERVSEELELIGRKDLVGPLLRALEVLELAGDDVPHVTRGSCGSSLVCYLLGISHVDPVAHGISFARFLNEFRDSLPDIDFDFPHNQRADIFLRMALRWPGQVARISNHVHFHEKSAIREALRRRGHKGTMTLADQHRYMAGLNSGERQAVEWEAEALDGEFRCYSLHCGGVVYYPEGVPEEALLEGKRGGLLAQIREDKRDISEAGLFKIDVLSSRALSQLVDAMKEVGLGVGFDLANPPFTAAMAKLLASGRNIGITLAESRLACSEFRDQAPTTVGGVAACMALIRPAAREAEGEIVFDDDAIRIIAERVGCTEAEADKYRRGLAKKDEEMVAELRDRIDPAVCESLESELGSLALYGFCKAHAMSYAQLVCWLTWCKVEHPKAFWKGALNNCHSSYRPWVHMWEAWNVGVDPFDKKLIRNQKSVYTDARQRKYWELSQMEQLYQHWHWDVRKGFIDGCYVITEEEQEDGQKQKRRFRGVIAASRILTKNKVAICVGVGDEYIDVICSLGTFSGAKRFAKGWVNSDGQGTCSFN